MRYAIQDKKRFIGLTLFCLNASILGVIVRLPGIYFLSHDYTLYLRRWYYIIADERSDAFLWDFSNYNVLYPYLLYLAVIFLPNLSPLVFIKAVSIVFDFVLAFFVYKCVRFKYTQQRLFPCLAALATLFAPFVILNSSVWGQSDSIYTAFLIACLYALLKDRQAWAFIAFGVSFSFKLQAIFLAPFIICLVLKNRVKWRYLLCSLPVYLVTLLPAWHIGRPLRDLLLIYFNLTQQYEKLSLGAPNPYQWIPIHYYHWYPLGVVFTIFVVLGVALLIFKSRVDITPNLLVYLATFSTLIVPFFLPKMHDRYFFPAGVIAIVLAFYLPKYWSTAVVVGLVSTLTMLPNLYKIEPVPLSLLAVVLLVLIAVLGWKLLRILEHRAPPPNTPSTPSAI